MSEDKKNDTVSIDEHNRIVATANARQAELEDMRRQVSDLKSKVSDVESIQKLKEEWNKESKEVKQAIEEIKKNVDNSRNSKAVVKGYDSNGVAVNDPIAQIDKVLPNRGKNPEQFASRLSRLGHYKNPTSAAYTREQMGAALSLQAGAQRIDKNLVVGAARPGQSDIVLSKQ